MERPWRIGGELEFIGVIIDTCAEAEPTEEIGGVKMHIVAKKSWNISFDLEGRPW
jgi:hypothetical protein